MKNCNPIVVSEHDNRFDSWKNIGLGSLLCEGRYYYGRLKCSDKLSSWTDGLKDQFENNSEYAYRYLLILTQPAQHWGLLFAPDSFVFKPKSGYETLGATTEAEFDVDSRRESVVGFGIGDLHNQIQEPLYTYPDPEECGLKLQNHQRAQDEHYPEVLRNQEPLLDGATNTPSQLRLSAARYSQTPATSQRQEALRNQNQPIGLYNGEMALGREKATGIDVDAENMFHDEADDVNNSSLGSGLSNPIETGGLAHIDPTDRNSRLMDQIAPPEPTQISETRKVRCPSCFNIMAPRSFYKHKDRCKRMPRRIAGGCTFHGCSWLASSRGDISDHLLREHRVYGSEAWRYQVPKLLRITRPNLILEIVDENRRWNELAASARSERQRLEEHPGVTVVPDLPADLPPLTLVQPTDGESVEGPIKKYLAEAVVQRRKQIMGLTKWLEEVRRLP